MVAPDRMPSPDGTPRPSLKRELLVNFALLTGAAISLAVLSALIAQLFAPRFAALGIILLIVADVLVLFAFGRYLLEKLVLGPVADLVAATDELAGGNLEVKAEPAATAELAQLADRFNVMTERLAEAQAELLRAEKLASIGRLATGIAHEIGNPLSAVANYVEVLRRRGSDPDLLDAVNRETERIDRIVRSLLAYARPKDDAVATVDVDVLVRSVFELLERQGAFQRLRPVVELPDVLPPVRATAHGLEQTLVNLLLNAVDAAPDGTVVIGARAQVYRADVQAERREADAATGAVPRRRAWRRPQRPEIAEGTLGVLLWVADSGPGIPEADRDVVFDPFYSTKEPGLGTGLGLAIVQGTVHELGGLVWVERAREGGAAFKIFLPAASHPVAPVARGA
jgi:two-component system NtrC family sensor kinase